jgi:hypothetical protein
MVKEYYFDRSQMLLISAFSESNMWDRAEVLTPNTSIKCITPIGQVGSLLDIHSICLLRAKQLAELAVKEDKKLYVFWSGGLDSTTVLLALREFLAPELLGVMYTKASIEEYPGFFENNIQDVYEAKEFSMSSLWAAVDYACLNGIAVTGEIADQIFGSVMFLGRSPEQLQLPWQEFHAGLTKEQKVHAFVEACPIEVKNMAQFLWWFNYATKYQNVQVRMLVDNTSSVLNKNIFHFFDTKEFNDYAISTDIEEKIPLYDNSNYKKPLRDFIFKVSGDADYAYNKPKVRSLVPVYGKYSLKRIAKTIDLNWVRGYK